MSVPLFKLFMNTTLIMKYYIRFEDEFEYEGPYSLEELKLFNLKRSTRIWRKGILDWTPAGELEELNVLFDDELDETVEDSKPQSLPLPDSTTRIRLWVIVFLIVLILTLALLYRFIR